jgi:hypothetical protein
LQSSAEGGLRREGCCKVTDVSVKGSCHALPVIQNTDHVPAGVGLATEGLEQRAACCATLLAALKQFQHALGVKRACRPPMALPAITGRAFSFGAISAT